MLHTLIFPILLFSLEIIYGNQIKCGICDQLLSPISKLHVANGMSKEEYRGSNLFIPLCLFLDLASLQHADIFQL